MVNKITRHGPCKRKVLGMSFGAIIYLGVVGFWGTLTNAVIDPIKADLRVNPSLGAVALGMIVAPYLALWITNPFGGTAIGCCAVFVTKFCTTMAFHTGKKL